MNNNSCYKPLPLSCVPPSAIKQSAELAFDPQINHKANSPNIFRVFAMAGVGDDMRIAMFNVENKKKFIDEMNQTYQIFTVDAHYFPYLVEKDQLA